MKVAAKFAILIPAFAFSIQLPLEADVIVLKNGTKRVGKIIAQTRSQIRFRSVNGRVWVFPKSQIRRLTFGQVDRGKIRKEERRKAEKRRRLEQARKQEEERRKAEERRRLEKKRRESEQQESEKKAGTSIAPLGALRRSAVFPGWGQWERGEKLKGGLFAGGALAGAFAIYETNRIYQNTARDLNALGSPASGDGLLLLAAGLIPGTPSPEQLANPATFYLYNYSFEAQQARLDRKFGQVQAASYLLAGIYIWNLIDAYFFHPSRATSGFGTSKSKASLGGWSFVPVLSLQRDGATFPNKMHTRSAQYRHEFSFTKRIDF